MLGMFLDRGVDVCLSANLPPTFIQCAVFLFLPSPVQPNYMVISMSIGKDASNPLILFIIRQK
jgi:hypothetical protein